VLSAIIGWRENLASENVAIEQFFVAAVLISRRVNRPLATRIETVTHRATNLPVTARPQGWSEPMKDYRRRTDVAIASIAALLLTVSGGMAQQTNGMADMAGMKMAPAPAGSATVKAGNLDLSGGYVKAMLPGQPVGGGYLTIHNGGSSADRLVSVSSSAAAKVELHEMTMKDNIMRMRELKDGIAIAAGATVSLSPNTLHMMFKQVKAPFRQGGTVAVTLTFEKAGAVAMTLPVISASGN
jgi:copper(I)-binding protein